MNNKSTRQLVFGAPQRIPVVNVARQSHPERDEWVPYTGGQLFTNAVLPGYLGDDGPPIVANFPDDDVWVPYTG